MVASERPKILKFMSLQLGKYSFKISNNFVLSIVSRFSLVQPENSLKILCSMPKWYPDISALLIKVIINKLRDILLLRKKYPKKHIIIEII